MAHKHLSDSEFAALWAKAQPMATSYVLAVVRDHHETEDLVQKVASIAFEKRNSYDSTRPFGAWVSGIARLELLHWRRSKARNRVLFTPDTIEKIDEGLSRVEDEIDDRRAALSWCMQKLSGKGRRLIEMQYLGGLAPTQIAQQLDAKPASIRGALHRIRESLHRCIDNRIAAATSTKRGRSNG